MMIIETQMIVDAINALGISIEFAGVIVAIGIFLSSIFNWIVK